MESALSSLSLCFLLLAFTTNFPSAFSGAPEKVTDTQGRPISGAGKYYISQVNGGATGGGGLFLAQTGNSKCQVTILQDYYDGHRGLAVKLGAQGAGSGGVFTGTPLDVALDLKPSCASSSKWVVVADGFSQKWVGIGGGSDHPGAAIVTGTLKIEKYNEGYKFVFCVSATTCSDIGTLDDGETGKRLVLTNNAPFKIAFVSAT
ncbi:hypothetical protein PHAVU_004G130500 [Phaseolus vulgaris]|uniref:Uncharacterized protein n=1 Tax=Phaseolus vulgaris TaxID=3885 RepID=V7C2N7_PHAVU|nr:hypothetical protein PHAVU_004G130500g [Phaseolus vulgaris]ESW24432.1 hypothetical protein PHAVU_004G130500g [Phaseolus vulgaris]